MTKSILDTQMISSPLQSASVLSPKGGKVMRQLAAALTITSLVDAFCMIVIYLMFNISPSTQASEMKVMNIPAAHHSDVLTSGIIVRVEGGNRFFINDQEVPSDALVQHLAQHKVAPETPADQIPNLVIQADREINFSAFNPIILAGAQNGFTTFKFAVINQGE